ncbi:MAG: T9SS type A sorting domain-containing protein [Sphingobacteriales bacterium]|nr:MAG: T9SS type A sorting domain-containing protein [Sphingobacteriales bacterium]
MYFSIRRVILTATALLAVYATQAQSQTFYRPHNAPSSESLKTTYGRYRLVQQDIPALTTYIRERTAALRGTGAVPMIVTVPLPDGTDVRFVVRDADIFTPEFADQHPDLKALKGTSEDGYFSLRLTTSSMGMIAHVQGRNGEQFYATPLSNTAPEDLLVYDAKALRGLPNPSCGFQESLPELKANLAPLLKTAHGDDSIRTYRMAVAATGEYTSWAGSQANALIQISALFNSVTDIYERELGVHFTLVSPAAIRFTDAATDPYSLGDISSTTLTENQTTLNSTTYLGSANYDLGMVVTAVGGGGLASKPSVCSGSFKARSVSGMDPASFPTGPSGPAFINMVAHETGHQFDASHSFAANTGGCSGNTVGSTGWEPGGGSTIMAYAGVCTGLTYQKNSDFYFHTGSLLEMSAYTTSGNGKTCGSRAVNTNAAPTALVAGGTAFTIPVNTPFRLRASTTQSQSNTLTYAFDQYDPVGGSGTSTAPAATNTSGPMFRSFPPGANNTQYFPSLAALTGLNSTTYEVVPSVARTLNFRYTVRDNVPYTSTTAGRTANGSATVTMVACPTPFAVTSQTTSGSFAANGTNTMTITWNTATSCATCGTVNIRFSRDGGLTFPYLLLNSTANDGTESIKVPNLSTDRGRVLVECVDNVHFNINSANQTITTACAAEGTIFTPATDLYVSTTGTAALNQTLAPSYGTAITAPLSGTIATTNDSGELVIFNGGNCTTYNNTTKYARISFTPGTSGSYTFTRTVGSNISMSLYDSSVLLNAPCRNLIGGDFTVVTATLSKNKVYTLLVSYYGLSYPAPYTISVNGGTLYTATPSPGAGFNYSYIIVSNTTNAIKEIRADGNMTNATTYPAGNYTIYGLSSNTAQTTLNSTYSGASLTAFRKALQDQSGGLCGSMSSNARRVAIATPLPVTLLSFDGRLTSRRNALLYWEADNEATTRDFILERSYDGQTFQTVGHVLPGRALNGAYSLTDNGIREEASEVYYRLRMVSLSGMSLFSGTVRLTLDATRIPEAFSILPNPVQNGMLHARIATGADENYQITVFDLAGRKLFSQPVTGGQLDVTVPVGSFSPGLYLVELRGEHTLITQRFVKP